MSHSQLTHHGYRGFPTRFLMRLSTVEGGFSQGHQILTAGMFITILALALVARPWQICFRAAIPHMTQLFQLIGAYLVEALAHCGECHTPRDWLGGPKAGMAFAGTTNGPEGGLIPNITPDKETGIGRWSDGDLEELFKSGMLPDGDFVGDVMGDVVDDTTGRLNDADIKAIILYLRSVAPVSHRIERKKK